MHVRCACALCMCAVHVQVACMCAVQVQVACMCAVQRVGRVCSGGRTRADRCCCTRAVAIAGHTYRSACVQSAGILVNRARPWLCRAEVVKLHAEVARLRQAVREGDAKLQQKAGEGSSRETEVAALQLELKETRRQLEVGVAGRLDANCWLCPATTWWA